MPESVTHAVPDGTTRGPNTSTRMSTNPPSEVGKAWELFQAGRQTEAEASMLKLAQSGRERAQALLALGILANMRGQIPLAIRRMQEALAVDPKLTKAASWLCKLLTDQGDPQAAIRFGEQAVRSAPDNLEAHHLLIAAYAAAGRSLDARAQCDKALKLAPNDASFHYQKAEVLLLAGWESSAAEALREATALQPTLGGMRHLAKLQIGIGLAREAAETAAELVRQDPDDMTSRLVLARALTETQRDDEARPHWQRLQATAPQSSALRLERARSLIQSGKFDEAVPEIMAAIELDETEGGSYHLYVGSRKMTEADAPFIRRMEALLARPGISDGLASQLWYALGKSYDDLGQYAQAMASFDRANRILLAQRPAFDPRRETDLVDNQIATFHPALFEKWRGHGMDSELPLLVVGLIRSGTTLTEQILTNHSAIAGAGEQAFWNENAPLLQHAIGRDFVDFSAVRKLAKQYLSLLTAVAPAKQGGKRYAIDKSPGNTMYLGLIKLAFPNSRVLHLRRNPVDNALSIWMTPMRTDAAFLHKKADIVHALRERNRLADYWKEIFPSDRFREVSYESLTGEPERVVRDVIDFLGLEWQDACLDPRSNRNAVRTPSYWQARQPINTASTERWRRYEPWLGEFAELLD